MTRASDFVTYVINTDDACIHIILTREERVLAECHTFGQLHAPNTSLGTKIRRQSKRHQSLFVLNKAHCIPWYCGNGFSKTWSIRYHSIHEVRVLCRIFVDLVKHDANCAEFNTKAGVRRRDATRRDATGNRVASGRVVGYRP